MMTNERTDTAIWEGTEEAAWSAIFELAPERARAALRLSRDQHDALTVYRASQVPSAFFNRVVVRLGTESQRELLDAELDRFTAAGTPHGVALPPGARPPELPSWLAERGLTHTSTLARMVRGTDDLPSPTQQLHIRLVDREDAALFGETLVRGFGLPPACSEWLAMICGRSAWRPYLAYDGDEPVGTGALFVHGEVGWIGFGSTLPTHRNRGFQGAMMARRMSDAADLGCTWLQTETNLPRGDEPSPSLNNMKRLGFRMAYERPNYTFTPSLAADFVNDPG